jgi:succinate dehydrogenase/fumarate reductase flavoprotein subunit
VSDAPTSCDAEAELIVVGFGAAGACAAITAADAGATVLLLEKQPAEWHTPSTRASGGQVMAVSDVEQAVPYLDRCGGGMIPIEVSRAWAEKALDVVDWVRRKANLELVHIADAEHSDWEGGSAISAYVAREAWVDRARGLLAASSTPRPGGGAVLFAALEQAVKSRDQVTVLYEHPAKRLLTDASGRVIGVEAMTPEGARRFRARRGVVLTCGGYEYDEEMKRGYLRSYPTYFYGSPMNTGDGVRMAQALGADLWHMNSMIGRAIAHFELDGKSFNFLAPLAPGGYVFLDRYGRRFANEYMQAISRHDFYYELMVYDSARAEYPRVPCYWIFDSRRMEAAPPVGGSAAAGPYKYEWSEASRDEIGRGWVKTASTLEELVRRIEVSDPDQACQTLNDYNRACTTGEDSLGRPRESLVPLDRPPFYCMPLWPGGPNTSGGPRRNEHAEVLDVFGQPIPGLYEAGELGEAVGALYPSNGANISDALCFGRIAVERALSVTAALLTQV